MPRLRDALSRLSALHLGALALVAGVAVGVACGGPVGDCRYDPACGGGGAGAFCNVDADCFNGYCCEKDQCGGGMCSYSCKRDDECPADMACEHDVCLFICNSDADCLDGQTCDHKDPGVCEWD